MRGREWDVVATTDGNHTVLHLFGEIDMDCRADLIAEVDAAIANDSHHIEFDFRTTSFCGSDCIGILVHARRSDVKVSVRPSPMLLRVMEVMGLVDGLGIVVL